MSDVLVDLMEVVLAVFLSVCACMLAGVLIYVLCIWLFLDGTFSLQKDEWVCSSSHVETVDAWEGKITVRRAQEVCDVWSRK